MIDYIFENELVKLHCYQFGKGKKAMLCFHGYGMHGKQFKVLKETLGDKYTFYGFDLFFHKETKLIDQSVEKVKKGITKRELSELFLAFCDSKSIDKFSVISYSMGSFYATALVEEVPDRIEKFITAAPSSLNPGRVVNFLSTNSIGNKILERLALSDNGMLRLLSSLKRSKIIDEKAYEILHREIATPELRFSFYACTSYLRFLKLNPQKFIQQLNHYHIESIFIFGKRDKSYPVKIGRNIIPQISNSKQLIIDENHDMINQNFAKHLSICLNDH
ncbi:alpha/beta hydrolase [Pedobacter psychrophilus]|uniref:Alpha/beta hydrolase n=1 Tax=Pedobacter psychrophilus TaxID=1826909 RepID=A0A179DKV0_9SPHI|nr:alpha/beta hydrolase [Pedobacter psychrophilus]OAQ41727.1 alpha/beta hydrolase [Pedobacter psychrophilus]